MSRPRSCIVDKINQVLPVIMPPSALANLTALDLESPWMFKLSNPANPAASTHAGVLEFIAEEGCVHLPYWMMKTLRLNEGDPIRITGAELPKGKLIKLQAQSVHFLEISDPKAVYVTTQPIARLLIEPLTHLGLNMRYGISQPLHKVTSSKSAITRSSSSSRSLKPHPADLGFPCSTPTWKSTLLRR